MENLLNGFHSLTATCVATALVWEYRYYLAMGTWRLKNPQIEDRMVYIEMKVSELKKYLPSYMHKHVSRMMREEVRQPQKP